MTLTTTYLNALANHLWQSTVFAAAAAILAFALRKNSAKHRHGVWLIASFKFLLPFSLLSTIGNHLELVAARPMAPAMLPEAVQQISHPFTFAPAFGALERPVAAHPVSIVPTVLFALWLCGFLTLLFLWLRSWIRLRLSLRAARPLSIECPVKVFSSPSLMEPGVFGIVRPVLVLPEGITGHLAPEHLNAILAHELCHVRRRDNLAAAVHMFVEALFWFHPLVWWIGARLVEERERACDEEVVRLGNQPDVYAESILKTCQFYVESPLTCVSGVTGSDLKKRVVHIMTDSFSARLTFGKKLLLSAAAITALLLPIAAGLLNAKQNGIQSTSSGKGPSFEVATIKPTKPGGQGVRIWFAPGARFSANNVTLKTILEEAYDVKDSQIAQAPPWFDSDHWDIEAKPDDAQAAALDKLPPDQRMPTFRQMMQNLLTDRFKLTLGHETKDLPVYVLTVAKGGPKFHETTFKEEVNPPTTPPPPGKGPQRGIWLGGPGKLSATDADISMFANVLSRAVVGRVVLDKTGLTGKYDFTLQWTPAVGEPGFRGAPGGPPGPNDAPPPEASGPSIFTALQEQLGLKLESQKAPMDVLVIQHAEKPSEN